MYAKLLEHEGDEENDNIWHSRKEQKEDDSSIDSDINDDRKEACSEREN